MKILLDAQLPRSLVPLLQAESCDALHRLDLPDGNRTTDNVISALAEQQGQVVYSKQADFPVVAAGVAVAEKPLYN